MLKHQVVCSSKRSNAAASHARFSDDELLSATENTCGDNNYHIDTCDERKTAAIPKHARFVLPPLPPPHDRDSAQDMPKSTSFGAERDVVDDNSKSLHHSSNTSTDTAVSRKQTTLAYDRDLNFIQNMAKLEQARQLELRAKKVRESSVVVPTIDGKPIVEMYISEVGYVPMPATGPCEAAAKASVGDDDSDEIEESDTPSQLRCKPKPSPPAVPPKPKSNSGDALNRASLQQQSLDYSRQLTSFDGQAKTNKLTFTNEVEEKSLSSYESSATSFEEDATIEQEGEDSRSSNTRGDYQSKYERLQAAWEKASSRPLRTFFRKQSSASDLVTAQEQENTLSNDSSASRELENNGRIANANRYQQELTIDMPEYNSQKQPLQMLSPSQSWGRSIIPTKARSDVVKNTIVSSGEVLAKERFNVGVRHRLERFMPKPEPEIPINRLGKVWHAPPEEVHELPVPRSCRQATAQRQVQDETYRWQPARKPVPYNLSVPAGQNVSNQHSVRLMGSGYNSAFRAPPTQPMEFIANTYPVYLGEPQSNVSYGRSNAGLPESPYYGQPGDRRDGRCQSMTEYVGGMAEKSQSQRHASTAYYASAELSASRSSGSHQSAGASTLPGATVNQRQLARA